MLGGREKGGISEQDGEQRELQEEQGVQTSRKEKREISRAEERKKGKHSDQE